MDQKSSIFSLQLYYIALGTADVKLDSLIELITVLESLGPLSLVICCASRDVLDAVAVALRSIEKLSLWCLYSDLSEREIDVEVQSFRRSVAAITLKTKEESSDSSNAALENDDALLHHQENQSDRENEPRRDPGSTQEEDKKQPSPPFRSLCALITTEAPLRAINKESTPLAPTLLINYDIPVRKEDYVRRIATVLGGRAKAEKHRLCINFLEAGKVHELRQLEEFADREVKEMPVHVADVFEQTRGGSGSGGNKQK